MIDQLIEAPRTKSIVAFATGFARMLPKLMKYGLPKQAAI
jgi:hypothetical protein